MMEIASFLEKDYFDSDLSNRLFDLVCWGGGIDHSNVKHIYIFKMHI